MTLDDGTPGLKQRLNLIALGFVIVLVLLARACALRSATAPPDVPVRSEAVKEGTSVSKDHGASAGAEQDK